MIVIQGGGGGERMGGEVTTENPHPSDTQLRAVICDDSTLNGECLTIALRANGIEADFAGDFPSLFSQFESGAPDVLLLNIGTTDSATLLHLGQDLGPDVRVIVTGLSTERESDIVTCAEAGVAGLHLRTESFAELLAMIRNPSEAGAQCSPAVSAILLRRVYSLVGQKNPASPDPMLTDRENQILQLIEEGLSNQQVASRLNVSIHTVKNHAHSMFGKLGVSTRAEAVAVYRAMRHSNVGSL